MTDGTIIVTIADVRAAKLCVAGARQWFKRYDLDFRDFLNNGLSVEFLRTLDDPIAELAIAAALERVKNG